MPSKTYSYKIVITNTIDNRNFKQGVNELDKELSRTEKRLLKQIELLEKYEKALSAANRAAGAASKIPAVDNSRTGGGVTGRWEKEHQQILKTSQMLLRYENQLAKLKGSDSELAKLNRQLEQPGVAAKINETTQALLRQKAAAIDLERESQKATKAAGTAKVPAIRQEPTFTDYRDIDALEKKVTTAVEREAEAQKFARQVAAKKAYEAQFEINNKTVAASEAAAKKITKVEADAWRQMLADEKKHEQASIHTNAVLAESAKVLANYKIKEAKRANLEEIKSLKETESASKQPKGAFSSLFNGSFFENLGAATVGIATVATGALTLGATLFNLAKNASDYGSTIKDASDKTGLGAETISTLKLAADQSGSSLEAISGSVTKFSKLIGSAAEGSKEAKESLSRLGLDPKQAINDLDGSLEKVFKSIYDAKNPIVATKLATEAFGKSGADVIPVIKQMNGNFGAFKDEAKKLGVVLSTDDVNAADDFGDALTALEAQAKGAAGQFAFGFMPAITTAFKEISGELSDNQNVWRQWGETVGGVILRIERGAKVTAAVIRDLLSGNYQGTNTQIALQQNADAYDNDSRQKEIRANSSYPNRPDFLKQQDAAIKRIGNSSRNNSGGLEDFTQQASLEAERQQKLSLTKSEQAYKLQDALLKSHLADTTQQQLTRAKESQILESNYLNEQLKIQKVGFAKQLAAVGDDAGKREKITAERNETLAKLSGDLKVKEITNQKEIADLEKRIFDERRQAAIEFQNLIVQQVRFGVDKQTFAIETALENQTVSIDEGYKKLLDLTKESFFKVSSISREQLNLQLQDKSLSNEQRLNLIVKGYLDERQAAEENSRAIKEIEKRRTAAALQEIQNRTEAQIKFISNAQIGADNLSIFGDVGGVSSFNNFGKLLEKAKDLSLFFEQSNRGQATFFKGQADYYKALIPVTKEALERAQRTRAAMLPTESAFPSPTTDLATGELVQQTALPQIDKRMADADAEIAKMQARIESYKGATSQFNALAVQYSNYADGIEKTYGSLQAEVFNLYDSISKGAGNNTVFDQIIEKSYLAQRELEKASLSAKVQGLTSLLAKAQEGLESGSSTGLEVARVQSELTQAEQSLKAFNFQTDVGKEKLDTLGNAAARFKKIISGDKIEIEAIKQFGKTDLEKQKGSLAAENIILEQKYYADVDLLAQQYRNKQLQYERDVFEIRQELAQKAVFSETEATAKILSHIEQSTKSASDIFADAFIDAFDRTANHFDKMLDKIGVGKIPILGDIIKAQSRNLLGAISNSLLGDIFPDVGNTNNPILNENQKQTKSLQNIENAVTGVGAVSALSNVSGGASNSGGGILGMLKKVFGGFLGNRSASATPNFNPNSINSTSPTSGDFVDIGDGIKVPLSVITGNRGGGIGSSKGASGLSSIFGEKGFGNNVGTYGAIGSVVALLGSLVGGGRFGGLLSGAGSGLALGAQIGSIIPGIGTAIGAGVGAVVGGLIGLITGGTRKKDEKTRNQATLDAFSAIDKLIQQVNNDVDFTDAAGVISQGATIRQNYLDSANSLKDKKTRNIALKDVSRIDEKLRQLETLAKAKASKTKSRQESLLLDVPTFSDGGSVSDFMSKNFQNNPLGYVSGAGSSRSDSINAFFPQAKTFARISNSEYVLDSETTKNIGIAQLDRLRANKGRNFDRLKYVKTPLAYADGGAIGSPSVNGQSNAQNFGDGHPPKVETHIYIQSNGNQTESVKSETYWTSPEGKRMLIDTVEEEIYRGGKDGKIYKAVNNVANGNR